MSNSDRVPTHTDTKEFSLGCNGRGIMHRMPLSVDEQFRMIKESEVFDHFDRIPQPGEESEYLRASEKYGVPMTTGLWTYVVNQDEELVRTNLRFAKEAGIACHNLMISARRADGAVVTDDEVAEIERIEGTAPSQGQRQQPVSAKRAKKKK